MADIAGYFGYDQSRANYLVHVSRRHQALFVEVPKTGCTVVKRVLQLSEFEGEESRLPRGEDIHLRELSPLPMPRQMGDQDRLFGADASYYRFSFVRNPFTRILSCYLDKIVGRQAERDIRLPQIGVDPMRDISFLEFLERIGQQEHHEMDIHWAPQVHLLALPRMTYDFLGRFESFQADMNRLMSRLSIEIDQKYVVRRSKNVTNATSRILEHYGDREADLVRGMYRDDFERLGYGRDVLSV